MFHRPPGSPTAEAVVDCPAFVAAAAATGVVVSAVCLATGSAVTVAILGCGTLVVKTL